MIMCLISEDMRLDHDEPIHCSDSEAYPRIDIVKLKYTCYIRYRMRQNRNAINSF